MASFPRKRRAPPDMCERKRELKSTDKLERDTEYCNSEIVEKTKGQAQQQRLEDEIVTPNYGHRRPMLVLVVPTMDTLSAEPISKALEDASEADVNPVIPNAFSLSDSSVGVTPNAELPELIPASISPPAKKPKGLVNGATAVGDRGQRKKRPSKEYKCTFADCERNFKQKSSLDEHFRVHTGERPYECPVCNKTFARKSTLLNHSVVHTKEKKFSCETCGKKFALKKGLTVHRQQHSKAKKPQTKKSCSKVVYKCTFADCERNFSKKSNMEVHLRVHTGEHPFKCSFENCGKEYKYKKNLDEHLRLHNGERPFVCDICDKVFGSSTNLWDHSAVHATERKFGCETCGRKFRRKRDLTAHLKLHANKREYSCERCDRSFNRKWHLKSHMRNPNCGRRTQSHHKLTCELCGKGYGSKTHLTRHMKISHKEAFPEYIIASKNSFTCKLCGKEYRWNGDRTRHMKTSHKDSLPENIRASIKTYSCNVCNKEFSRASLVKKHMKIHSRQQNIQAPTDDLKPSSSKPMENEQNIQLDEDGRADFTTLSHLNPSGQCLVPRKPSENFRDTMSESDDDSLESCSHSDTSSENWETDNEGDSQCANVEQAFSGSTAPQEYFEDMSASLEESLNSLPDLMMRLDIMQVNKEGPEGLNPLLQTVVLETFFRVADAEDLKTLRRVSKLWYRESLPRWRRDTRLVLDEDRGRRYIEARDTEGDPFLLAPYPFRKFRLRNWRIELQEGSDQSAFFAKFGPLIQDVKITNTVFDSKRSFNEVVFGLMPNLEVLALEDNNYLQYQGDELEPHVPVPQRNLKEVILKLVEMDKAAYLASTTHRADGSAINFNLPRVSWAEMLPLIPNLKKARLENVVVKRMRFPQHDVQSFLEAVGELRRATGCVLSLESLDILNAFGPASLEFPLRLVRQLRELQLPLTSLSIDSGVLTNAYTLKEVLEIHSSTLRNLKVFRAPYARPFENAAFRVRMERLEGLTLVGPISSDLAFLRFMPNLKFLRTIDPELNPLSKPLIGSRQHEGMQPTAPISLVDRTNFDELDLENIVISSLEEFLDGDAFCAQNEVNRLARVMPNLRTLRLGLDNAGLKTVLHNWKNLKALYIEPYEMVTELPPHLQSSLDFPFANTRRALNEVANLIAMLGGLKLTVNGSEGDKAVQLVTSSLGSLRFNR